jgi:hypothetical protein
MIDSVTGAGQTRRSTRCKCPAQAGGRGRVRSCDRPVVRGVGSTARHLPATTVPTAPLESRVGTLSIGQFAPRLAPRATWLAVAALAP